MICVSARVLSLGAALRSLCCTRAVPAHLRSGVTSTSAPTGNTHHLHAIAYQEPSFFERHSVGKFCFRIYGSSSIF